VVEEIDMPMGVPHSFMIAADVDGNDIWVGTGKGLGWGIGDGYYPGTRERPLYAYGQSVPGSPVTTRAPVAAAPEGPPASPPDSGKAPPKAGR
jgi:hypothetical protein